MVRTRPRETQSSSARSVSSSGVTAIEAVDLVEIDVFEAQALQAAGDLVHDMAARQADRVRAGADAAAHLGGDDDVLARDVEIAQRLAEQSAPTGLRNRRPPCR